MCIKHIQKEKKKYDDAGTRTNVARFRTALLSRSATPATSATSKNSPWPHVSLAAELAICTPGKINEV